MSEMVERVARAIAAEARSREPAAPAWDEIYPDVQDGLRVLARAAIAAMREPTEAMIEAYACRCDGGGDLLSQDGDPEMGSPLATDVSGAWRAMIDEALR